MERLKSNTLSTSVRDFLKFPGVEEASLLSVGNDGLSFRRGDDGLDPVCCDGHGSSDKLELFTIASSGTTLGVASHG